MTSQMLRSKEKRIAGYVNRSISGSTKRCSRVTHQVSAHVQVRNEMNEVP
jgi:hypothetical protein